MALPALEIEITADPTAADVGFKKLEKSLDGLEAATRDYQRALDRINTAERAGVVTTKQAASAIRGAEQAYESATRAAANYSGAQVAFRRSTGEAAAATGGLMTAIGRNNAVIQQAGYQVGDFAVQVGGGTSAITAFGQQASQLLGVFGAWGAVAGAAIAIAAPLSLALMDGAGSAKTLSQNLEALAEALEAVNAAQELSRTSIFDLTEKYGEYALAVGEVLAAQREIASLEAEMALSAAVMQLSDAFGNLNTVVDDMGQVIVPGAEEAFHRIIRTMDASSDQAYELVSALKEMGSAEGPEAQRAAINRVKDALVAATGGVSEMDEETRKVYSALLDAELAASRLAAIDIESGIGSAADSAARLATNLENSAKAWDAYNFAKQLPPGMTSGDGVSLLDLEYEDFRPPSAGGGTFSSRGGGKSGGGGGGGTPDTIGALAKSLMTQGEVIENWRAESLTKLNDFNALELEALGGHNEARLRIEQEYQSKLSSIKDAERQVMIQSVQGALGDVASLMQSGNKKIFAIGKAASIANAVISGYEAAVDAWKAGMKIGGPPVAAAFTAASLAKTGMLISNISSQQVGGGTSAGGGGGGGGATAAVSQQSLMVDLQVSGRGDLATDPSAIDGLASALIDNFKDRGIPIMVRA